MTHNFDNIANLGDIVFNVHYFSKILNIHKDMEINYYIRDKFINEIKKHINFNRLNISSINNKPVDSICGWFGKSIFSSSVGRGDFDFRKIVNDMGINPSYVDLNIKFFEFISNKINIDNPIKEKKDLLMENVGLLKNNILSDKFDVLIINSIPMSGQYEFNNNDFINLINEMKSRMSYIRIITTNHTGINDVKCTLDYDLSLIDIGNLSLYCDYVIGVHTSPLIYTFNVWNICKIKKWYVLHTPKYAYDYNENSCVYDKLNSCKDIIINEIYNNYSKNNK